MKNIADFLMKEMPFHIEEIQNDFECLYNRLDNTQSEIEEKLPLFKGNYAKIGEYYSMAEYSCAVTPQIRQTGNRLSGLAGTAYASLLA